MAVFIYVYTEYSYNVIMDIKIRALESNEHASGPSMCDFRSFDSRESFILSFKSLPKYL